MKLTIEERKALAAVREPASIYSKPLWQILNRLADLDLCDEEELQSSSEMGDA